MACLGCGGEHGPTPQTTAWADQFRAEFRDRARTAYSQLLASAGVGVLLTEEQMAGVDGMFQLGGSVLYDMLAERGALKKAEW